MKKKKIIFVSSSLTAKLVSSGIAGGEVRLAAIMKGFIEDNWEVHFLTNGGGKLFCELFRLNKVINHNFDIKEEITRLWFVIFTIKTLFRFPKTLKDFNGYIYTANELLFDVIPALKLKLINKNKWIAVVHWVPPLKFWLRKKSKFLHSLLFLIGEVLGLFIIKHFSNIVLAVSDLTARQLAKLGINSDKLFSVKCGVNFNKIDTIASKIKEKTYDAVFMKRIQAVKGVFDLIDIWEIVARKKPKAKLAIMGGGADNEQIISLIKSKNLENNIIFLGPIFDFERKIKILARSKLFILPSYEENWAIVMGEAMACKIPVLAYNLLELVDVWQNSFVQISLGDKNFFAEKIINYLDNKILRDKQAELGYQYVQQFEWADIAQKELEIITQDK
ncbi:MAG: glycosyltransferase family 4 protein [Parcubacteria group bacterium]|nr:glycosyltransferase family 4 protein [Parcubacteria group bacterium]